MAKGEDVESLLKRAVVVIDDIEYVKKQAAGMSGTANMMASTGTGDASLIAGMVQRKLDEVNDMYEELFDLVRRAQRTARK